MVRRAVLSLFLCVLALPGARHAAAQERVTIQGRVVDANTRRPLTDVSVAIPELDIYLVTDAEGGFEIRNAPVGVYDLRLSATGYANAAGDLAIMRPGSFVTTLTPLGGAGEAPRGRLVGRVSHAPDGRPVQGVRVHLTGLSLDVLTDESGRFVFPSVPPGSHAVEFSNLGYATRVDTIAVVADQTSDARVTMAVDPVELEPVEVIVEGRVPLLERRGFYERRRRTNGDFVERSDIEAWGSNQVTDVFRRVNGARIRLQDAMNPLSSAVILTRGIGTGGSGLCYPRVYVDGIIVHRGGDEPAMLNYFVTPDRVAGIEVYHGGSATPMEYGGTGALCGVIVVWTRDGA